MSRLYGGPHFHSCVCDLGGVVYVFVDGKSGAGSCTLWAIDCPWSAGHAGLADGPG